MYYGDTEFEHVNLATRISLAFQIAALKAGQLPFMVLDEAENMDSATWESFKAAAVASGFQCLVARVSDGPLNIQCFDEVTA